MPTMFVITNIIISIIVLVVLLVNDSANWCCTANRG